MTDSTIAAKQTPAGEGLQVKKLVAIIAVAVAACSSTNQAPPTAQQTPQALPTLTATLTPIGGSGRITFGVAGSLNNETLLIASPKSRFAVSVKKIAWSAELRESAGATTLTWILAKVSTGGSERIVWKQDVDVSNPDHDIFANTANLSLLVDHKPGTYVMRYLRDASVLAEGKFTLVAG